MKQSVFRVHNNIYVLAQDRSNLYVWLSHTGELYGSSFVDKDSAVRFAQMRVDRDPINYAIIGVDNENKQTLT